MPLPADCKCFILGCRSLDVNGLLPDPLVRRFFSREHQQMRKSPIVNRGTLIRTRAIDHYLLRLFQEHDDVQVISLGAGFDTRFFRLFPQQARFGRLGIYIEVDLEPVVAMKRKLLMEEIKAPCFEMMPLNLNDTTTVISALQKLADFSKPVVFVAECCFMYLDQERLDCLLSWIAALPKAVIISFDAIYIGDAFGQVMAANLRDRGLGISAFMMYPTRDSQVKRFRAAGFASVEAHSLSSLDSVLNNVEREVYLFSR